MERSFSELCPAMTVGLLIIAIAITVTTFLVLNTES